MEPLLSLLYGVSSIAALVSYVPQIVKYHRAPDTRDSISLLAWSGWTATSAVSFFYAWYVVKNPLFAMVACLNVTAQAVVLSYGVIAKMTKPLIVRETRRPSHD